ncbi:MAG: ABC transporter ATP-binding protein [Planctomycetes bacterium]|nr:ABC transporter ATP-binding protein [Planctomycetota bacterium]MBI3834032.1 ABC transporter ATP-binding protein [Planctomycetota bacterium]
MNNDTKVAWNSISAQTGLEARAISKHFVAKSGTIPILKNVDLAVSAGDSVAIMGPSGSGKSTLLNILGTLEPPSSGELSIHGINPFGLPQRELSRFRNQRIGFVFQEAHLLPQCTALENVLIPSLAGFENRNQDNLAHATKLLDRVGLRDRANHRPGELSGGERQRVALARALINTPDLLLADEPTGSLDWKIADEIASLLLDVHKEFQTVLVVATHSESLAERMSERWRLVDGRLEQF